VDESAVAEAYRLYATAIWRRSFTILRNDAAALDVSQEVFVRCLRHHTRLRPGRELLGWLYRVATNLCLNQLRDQRVLAAMPTELAAGAAPTGDDTARLTLAAILRDLDRRSQELAIYVFVDGMTHQEAAAVAGVSERTVRNRLSDFLRHRRSVLGIAPQEEST
jgi:RNA polymerase sigma-70 factor (ECF subfamily)